MPNHVENDLYVTGSRADRDRMLAQINGEEILDFRKIIPWAAGESDDEQFRWAVDNWGTKWNCYDSKILRDEAIITVITFRTAWSAPNPIVLKLSEQFPSLKFVMRSFERGLEWEQMLSVMFGHKPYVKMMPYDGERGG